MTEKKIRFPRGLVYSLKRAKCAAIVGILILFVPLHASATFQKLTSAGDMAISGVVRNTQQQENDMPIQPPGMDGALGLPPPPDINRNAGGPPQMPDLNGQMGMPPVPPLDTYTIGPSSIRPEDLLVLAMNLIILCAGIAFVRLYHR